MSDTLRAYPLGTPDDVANALTDRLLREYAERVPPSTVRRCVDNARHAVRFLADRPAERAAILERIARADLDQLPGPPPAAPGDRDPAPSD